MHPQEEKLGPFWCFYQNQLVGRLVHKEGGEQGILKHEPFPDPSRNFRLTTRVQWYSGRIEDVELAEIQHMLLPAFADDPSLVHPKVLQLQRSNWTDSQLLTELHSRNNSALAQGDTRAPDATATQNGSAGAPPSSKLGKPADASGPGAATASGAPAVATQGRPRSTLLNLARPHHPDAPPPTRQHVQNNAAAAADTLLLLGEKQTDQGPSKAKQSQQPSKPQVPEQTTAAVQAQSSHPKVTNTSDKAGTPSKPGASKPGAAPKSKAANKAVDTDKDGAVEDVLDDSESGHSQGQIPPSRRKTKAVVHSSDDPSSSSSSSEADTSDSDSDAELKAAPSKSKPASRGQPSKTKAATTSDRQQAPAAAQPRGTGAAGSKKRSSAAAASDEVVAGGSKSKASGQGGDSSKGHAGGKRAASGASEYQDASKYIRGWTGIYYPVEIAKRPGDVAIGCTSEESSDMVEVIMDRFQDADGREWALIKWEGYELNPGEGPQYLRLDDGSDEIKRGHWEPVDIAFGTEDGGIHQAYLDWKSGADQDDWYKRQKRRKK